MINEFLHKKIAVLFYTQEEHAFILRCFNVVADKRPVSGICSFYREIKQTENGRTFIVGGYACAFGQNKECFFADYIILTFKEFEFLIDETICPGLYLQ